MSSSALAQSTSDDLARRHFDSGAAYLEESDYDNALKAFQKSFELSKRPEILLNIATVYERKSDLPAALTALRSYLDAAPQGEHVETVRLRIQNLEKRLEAQKHEAGAEVPASAPPPLEPAPAGPPASGSAPANATTPRSAAAHAPEPTPDAPPKAHGGSRLPAFISLGVGGLLGGAALATGLIANAKYDTAKSSCSPNCTDAQLAGSRTFAVTSTVLTGAAALGVGLGVALLLTSKAEPSQLARKAPLVGVTVGPTAAAASATWRF